MGRGFEELQGDSTMANSRAPDSVPHPSCAAAAVVGNGRTHERLRGVRGEAAAAERAERIWSNCERDTLAADGLA